MGRGGEGEAGEEEVELGEGEGGRRDNETDPEVSRYFLVGGR